MRHQSVAMPFGPAAKQCGLPKSPGTEPRSLRSNIGVRAKDRFHSLIPSPAGQIEEADLHVFPGCARAANGHAAAPRRSVMSSRRCMCCPSEDHTLPHRCGKLPRCASQQNWPQCRRWVISRQGPALSQCPLRPFKADMRTLASLCPLSANTGIACRVGTLRSHYRIFDDHRQDEIRTMG